MIPNFLLHILISFTLAMESVDARIPSRQPIAIVQFSERNPDHWMRKRTVKRRYSRDAERFSL